MDGITSIDKVVAMYEVTFSHAIVPNMQAKVKVLSRSIGDFMARINVARIDRQLGFSAGECDLGDTEQEALDDLLTRFVQDARMHMPPNGYLSSDFEWISADEF